MIKHIVMWKLKGSTPAELHAHRHTVKRALESLRGKVPGLLRLEVGLDESGIDYAFDVVLYSEFESSAALAAYADHPERSEEHTSELQSLMRNSYAVSSL